MPVQIVIKFKVECSTNADDDRLGEWQCSCLSDSRLIYYLCVRALLTHPKCTTSILVAPNNPLVMSSISQFNQFTILRSQLSLVFANVLFSLAHPIMLADHVRVSRELCPRVNELMITFGCNSFASTRLFPEHGSMD